MSAKKPYINWTREQLFEHLEVQCKEYDYDLTALFTSVYDKRWIPSEDYNGCNVVQDDIHPFYPCFIHDYRWIIEGRTNNADIEFRNNLRKFGYSRIKALIYYCAVRVGSVFFNLLDNDK